MGNSEVGHLTIGSGRILFQDLMRVNKAIDSGAFFENEALRSAFERGENVHLLGLVSHGGVHSHIEHVKALLTFAPEKTWIHAFTDGRDVSPHSAVHDLAELPVDRIATVAGRYYAMDRDKRWDRTQRALDAIVNAEGEHASDPVAAVQASYDRGVTDEFIEPIVVDGRPRLDPARDTAIFFNFRPDRTRQLSEKLAELGVDLTTMTKYREDFDFPVVFPEQTVAMVMAEVLAQHGVRQLHAAETEKYAHVTYFFDGGREQEFPGETRVLVPSPRDVAGYDEKPEMSAVELTDRFVDVRGDQLREPGHGRPHGRHPGGGEGGGDDRRVPRAGGGRGRRARRRLSDHGRSRERREAARGRRGEPAHRTHDESRPADRHRPGSLPPGGGALRPRPDRAGPPGLRKARTNDRPKCGRQ